MSRTIRHLPENSLGLRHPHTQNEQRQLNTLPTAPGRYMGRPGKLLKKSCQRYHGFLLTRLGSKYPLDQNFWQKLVRGRAHQAGLSQASDSNDTSPKQGKVTQAKNPSLNSNYIVFFGR